MKEPFVEFGQVVHVRHGHEIVPSGEAQQGLDVPLLVGPPDQAELFLEQIVALEPEELAADLPISAPRDLRHGDLRIVVTDLPRHAPKVFERSLVAFEEDLVHSRWNTWQKIASEYGSVITKKATFSVLPAIVT